MSVHFASVFLYGDYQDDVCRFVEQVDQQNYEPLRERTCEAIRRMRQEWPLSKRDWTVYEYGAEKEVWAQEWPFYELGEGSLPTEDEIRSRPISQRELGNWFLIILAEYLRPCSSSLGNWSVLDAALADLGWDNHDRNLLFRGLSTATLLKPHIMEQPPRPLTDSSPYWFWLQPGWARSGWLPVGEIIRLHRQLTGIREAISTYDVRRIPDINIDNPIVVRDYKAYLQSGYSDTLVMLATAREANRELFMSITFYA